MADAAHVTAAFDAADILTQDDIPTKVVTVPGWKVPIRIKGLSSAETVELGKRLRTTKGGKANQMDESRFREWVIVYGCLKSDKDEPLFGAEHVPALQKKSAGAIKALSDAILTLSAMSGEAVDAAAEALEADPFSGS